MAPPPPPKRAALPNTAAASTHGAEPLSFEEQRALERHSCTLFTGVPADARSPAARSAASSSGSSPSSLGSLPSSLSGSSPSTLGSSPASLIDGLSPVPHQPSPMPLSSPPPPPPPAPPPLSQCTQEASPQRQSPPPHAPPPEVPTEGPCTGLGGCAPSPEECDHSEPSPPPPPPPEEPLPPAPPSQEHVGAPGTSSVGCTPSSEELDHLELPESITVRRVTHDGRMRPQHLNTSSPLLSDLARPLPSSEPPRPRGKVRWAPDVRSPEPSRAELHKRARDMTIAAEAALAAGPRKRFSDEPLPDGAKRVRAPLQRFS
jgi:hypothetical protein